MTTRTRPIVAALLLLAGTLLSAQEPAPQPQEQSFKFRTGVELINVNATVTDQSGRFVSGLNKDDFRVFEDEQPQTVTHFNAERVPVSLGIVLDTSGSMDGDKMYAAKQALERFLVQLLDPEDEVFLYRFDNAPELVEGWTRDKRRISDSIRRIQPRGGTALYDAVADAVQLAQQGRNKKKAVVIISDGNDTTSRTDIFTVKQLIRETEVLVYAIGIDSPGTAFSGFRRPAPSFQFGGAAAQLQRQRPPRAPIPLPFPIPGRRPSPLPPPQPPTNPIPGSNPRTRSTGTDDRVNVAALRDITDDSGGRTEIIRFTRDLDPATAGIADELSKQYYLGYAASGPKDGRWHAIRVEVRSAAYHVRARKGYVAGK
ncbi:MAG TPA: VWA domain-containing protein [Vicinamibacterales bacterium]|nr:VWA domain-containing protein [Vicinamibacterales bacterium]